MMRRQDDMAKREAAVWDRLARVMDPELDEPVTGMGFVERVTLDRRGGVGVEFRLPTYWCSPNFAYLMAEGIRSEVATLPWVGQVEVRLLDHLFAEQINRSVNAGGSFAEAFGGLAHGEDLSALRLKFDEKAFHRRQEAVLLDLRAQAIPDAAIADMRLGELDRAATLGAEAATRKPLYRALLVGRGLAREPDDRAFPTWSGETIAAADLPTHLCMLRSARLSMEFNGALCRGLKGVRYRQAAAGEDRLTIADFMPAAGGLARSAGT